MFNWIRKLFRTRKKFTKLVFPIIKNINTDLALKDLMSVQPMTEIPSELSIYFEMMDMNNPKTGQIFEVGRKYPFTKEYDCWCCFRNSDDYWHKMWEYDHWVYEKNLTSEEWKFKLQKYEC
jgi:hypothetical protein